MEKKYILTKDFLDSKAGKELTEQETKLLPNSLWKEIETKTPEEIFLELIEDLRISKYHEYEDEFYEEFHMSYDEVQEFLKGMLLKHLNCNVNITDTTYDDQFGVKNIF